MAISKIIFNGVVQMDVTGDTVTANTLQSGYTATGADGEPVSGSYTPITVEPITITTNDVYVAPTGKAYSPVTVNVAGGGGDTWSWAGKNPTKVKDYTKTRTYLKDTGFNTWTPSTTATTISTSNSFATETISPLDYDYIVTYEYDCHIFYSPATTTAATTRNIWTGAAYFDKYASLLQYIQTGTVNMTEVVGEQTGQGIEFYGANGTLAYYANQQYGIYPNSLPSNSVASGGSTNPTITIMTPQINARCSASYFSTASAANVDKDNSYYDLKITLWRVDAGTSTRRGLQDLKQDVYTNGIS